MISRWDLTVDGVRLNDLCRFTITDGLQSGSLPGVRLASVQLPGMDGVVPALGGDTFEPGSLVLKMYVTGRTVRGTVPVGSDAWTEYDANMDLLLGLFGNHHRLLDVRRTMGDGSVRRADCRVSDGFTPAPQGNGTITQFNVALEIPGVFWEDVDVRTFTGTAGSSSPHSETVSTLTGGTAPTSDATVTVSGPVTDPRVSQPDTGAYVQYSGTVGEGDTWTVDSAKWTSQVGASSVIADTAYAGSGARLLRLVPVVQANGLREVRVTLSGTGMGAGTNLSVTAKRKFF